MMEIGAQFFTVRDTCKTLEGFAETLAGCFQSGQTNESFLAVVNEAFGVEIAQEELTAVAGDLAIEPETGEADTSKDETRTETGTEEMTEESKISFDCESGGFFCYTAEFDLLENYGRRFKQLVEDKESFTSLVAEALKEEDVIRKEQEKLHNQVRGFLMRHRRSDIDMLTPYGRFLLTAKVGQKLLNGRLEEIRIGETVLSTDEFLSMTVTAAREDLIEPGYFQVKTESAKQEPEQNSCMSMSM